jgi:hypothetical protein
MRHTPHIALAVALVVSATACHRNQKAEQLVAIETAYQSGVFTKEEYEAKKQALMGTARAPDAQPKSEPAAAPPAEPPSPPDSSPPAPLAAPAASAAPAPAAEPAPAPPRATRPRPAPAPQPAQATSAAPPMAAAAPPVRPPVRTTPPAPAAPEPQPNPPTRATGADSDEPEPAPMAGCEDAEYKAGGANGVQERFFPAPVEAVRKAAALALQNLDFTIHKNASQEMEASKRKHFSAVVGAGGERLLLHFSSAQKGGQSGTRVTGETKKSFVGRLSQKSWTRAVLAQIACNLRSGR